MAIEAQGTDVSYTGNPESVGAVYFSQPVDLLGMQERQGDRLAQAVQYRNQRNLVKKKIASDMLGDLNVDFKGIMDSDAPYFKSKAAELATLYAQALQQGQDPSNPAFLEANTRFQSAKNQLLSEVQGSAAQKAIFMDVAKSYDPTKHADKTLQDLGAFRLATPAERQKMTLALTEKPKDLQTIIGGKLKGLDLKPQNVPTEKGQFYSITTDPKTGRDIMVQQTETIPLNMAANLMRGFETDNDFMDTAEAAWSGIQGTPTEQYYNQLAADYQQKGLPVSNAFDAFKLQQIYLNSQKDKQLSSLGENIYAKDALEGRKDKDEARGLYLDITKAFAGDPQKLQPDYYESMRTTDKFGKPTKINITAVKGYEGRPLGVFNYQVEQDGVKEIKQAPNIIQKTFRLEDGRLGVITTKSKKEYEEGKRSYPYEVFNTPYTFATALINGTRSESGDATKTDKLLGSLNDIEMEYRNKYGNDWSKQAGLTPEQVRQTQTIMKTPFSTRVINQPQNTAAPTQFVGVPQGGF